MEKYSTQRVNKDSTLKHEYAQAEWVLVPLGHWNWKWNSARANYSTYEQELLAGMFVLWRRFRIVANMYTYLSSNLHPCPQLHNTVLK